MKQPDEVFEHQVLTVRAGLIIVAGVVLDGYRSAHVVDMTRANGVQRAERRAKNGRVAGGMQDRRVLGNPILGVAGAFDDSRPAFTITVGPGSASNSRRRPRSGALENAARHSPPAQRRSNPRRRAAEAAVARARKDQLIVGRQPVRIIALDSD